MLSTTLLYTNRSPLSMTREIWLKLFIEGIHHGENRYNSKDGILTIGGSAMSMNNIKWERVLLKGDEKRPSNN